MGNWKMVASCHSLCRFAGTKEKQNRKLDNIKNQCRFGLFYFCRLHQVEGCCFHYRNKVDVKLKWPVDVLQERRVHSCPETETEEGKGIKCNSSRYEGRSADKYPLGSVSWEKQEDLKCGSAAKGHFITRTPRNSRSKGGISDCPCFI